MSEKISPFAILARDGRATGLFHTRDRADLSRIRGLEKKIDEEAALREDVRTQGTLP